MLEGTELSYAYSPIINSNGLDDGYSDFSDVAVQQPPVIKPKQDKAPQYNPQTAPPNNAITQQLAAIQAAHNQMHNQKPVAPPPVAPKVPQYDVSMFNKQFEQEQKIMTLMNELKKQKAKEPVVQHVYEDSYWDKMTNKKKELYKFIQSGLIILFAISLHVVIDFVLKNYLQANDVSYNREIMIRVLYPIGILFIAWNIIAFIR